jgi:enoyl-[acyl-carrier-protein] reductase (NADH)
MKMINNKLIYGALAASLFAFGANAGETITEQKLESDITKLRAEIKSKTAELEKCDPEKAKKLKTAGIVLTSVGGAALITGGVLTGVNAAKTKNLNNIKKEVGELQEKLLKNEDISGYSAEQVEEAAHQIAIENHV